MSFRIRHVISAQVAFDYATNTQSLYARHLEIARSFKRTNLWEAHVMGALLSTYAEEMRQPTTCMSDDELAKLVVMLDHYYLSQIAEGA